MARRSKRITGKQRAARKRNIKIAQAAKKKGGVAGKRGTKSKKNRNKPVPYKPDKLMNRLMSWSGGAGRRSFRGHQ